MLASFLTPCVVCSLPPFSLSPNPPRLSPWKLQAVHELITILCSATIRPLHYQLCTLFLLYRAAWERMEGAEDEYVEEDKERREGEKRGEWRLLREGERRELQRQMTSSSYQAKCWMTVLQIGAEAKLLTSERYSFTCAFNSPALICRDQERNGEGRRHSLFSHIRSGKCQM